MVQCGSASKFCDYWPNEKKDTRDILAGIKEDIDGVEEGMIYVGEKLYRQLQNIAKYKIPVVTFVCCKTSDLYRIFERLNSGGTTLQEYEIFAATWSTQKIVKIENTEIIKKIEAHYTNLLYDYMSYIEFDDQIECGEYNCYEFIIGLHGFLMEKKQQIRKNIATNQMFTLKLMTLIIGADEYSDLPNKLQLYDWHTLSEIILDIDRSLDTVIEIFSPHCVMSNSSCKIRMLSYPNSMNSLILFVVSCYKYGYEKIKKNSFYTRLFRLHLFYEIMTKRWSGGT